MKEEKSTIKNKEKSNSAGKRSASGSTKNSGSARTSGSAKNSAGSSAGKSAKEKNKKSGSAGCSLGTLLLLLLTAAVVYCCVFVIRYALNDKNNTSSISPGGDSTDFSGSSVSSFLNSVSFSGSSGKLPVSPYESNGSTPSSGLSVLTSEPSPSPVVSPSLSPVTPTPTTPTPPPSSSSEVEPDIQTVMFKPTSENDLRTVSVTKGGSTAQICYTYPLVVIPYSKQTEDKVNNSITESINRLIGKIEENFQRNYNPNVHDDYTETISAESSTIEIYRGNRIVSLVVYYTFLAGKGDFVQNVISINFDAFTGETVSGEDVVKDAEKLKEYLISALEVTPDLDIIGAMNKTSETGSAWYLDGDLLTVVFNGSLVYTTDPFTVSVQVKNQSLYFSD